MRKDLKDTAHECSAIAAMFFLTVPGFAVVAWQLLPAAALLGVSASARRSGLSCGINQAWGKSSMSAIGKARRCSAPLASPCSVSSRLRRHSSIRASVCSGLPASFSASGPPSAVMKAAAGSRMTVASASGSWAATGTGSSSGPRHMSSVAPRSSSPRMIGARFSPSSVWEAFCSVPRPTARAQMRP